MSKQPSTRRTGRPPRLIVHNPSWARQLGQASPIPVERLARLPPFGPPGQAPHSVVDEALIEGVVIAHRGGLVAERSAVRVLAEASRFAAWLEGHKPKHGPRRDLARAVWCSPPLGSQRPQSNGSGFRIESRRQRGSLGCGRC